MFRPTNMVALGGIIVFGLILADFLSHAAGTKAVANGAVALATPTIQGVSGQKVT